MSVVTGGYGGVLGLGHLRDILASTNCYVLNKPPIRVPFAAKKFDDDLRLTDETTQGFVRDMLRELSEFAPRFADRAFRHDHATRQPAAGQPAQAK
jgi:NAD(P)H-dependent FMN reductase